MQKLYSEIKWKNKPSTETPLNEQNLNRMDVALNALDDRVISQDTIKADKTDLNDLVSSWIMDEETGIITITKVSGEKILFDLNIEKIPVDFSLSSNGILTMTTDDGTKFTANIGAMIPVLTFNDSDTIAVSASGTGVNKTYSFSIKNGSVTEEKLQTDYLADIKVESAKAELEAVEAKTFAKQAQSYAIGTGNVRPNEATENAKTYYEKSKEIYDDFSTGIVTGIKGDKESSYRTGKVNLTAENIGALPNAGGTVTGTTIFSKATDASGIADNRPALIIGGTPETQHIEIDGNEIHSKTNATTPGTIDLNWDGGKVNLGKDGKVSAENGVVTAVTFNGTATTALKANQLNTARTIFGKSFDGTSDMEGKGTFYGTATDAANQRFRQSALEIRENNLNGNASTNAKYAPSIGFLWNNVNGARLFMNSNGTLCYYKQDGAGTGKIYGHLESQDKYTIQDTENREFDIIKAYGDGAGTGTQLVFGGGGNVFIGAGESSANLYTAFQTASNLGANEDYAKDEENAYITSDKHVYLYANTQTIANRVGVRLSQNGVLEPVKGSSIYLGTPGIGKSFQSVATRSIMMDGDYASITFGDESLGIFRESGGKLHISTSNGGAAFDFISSDLIIIPTQAGKYKLGDSNCRWKEVWCATSLNTSSDRNLKKNIKDLANDDRYIKFFMLLQPKSYLFKDGESGRTHIGFISQDVEAAMEECGLSSLEFAGFCKDQKKKWIPKMQEIVHSANKETGEEEWIEEIQAGFDEELVFDEDGNPVYEYSLRYEEFIAMNTMMIQEQHKKISNMDGRLSKLEKMIL